LKTQKLHIKSNSNPSFIEKKQIEYSYAFRELYKHFDTSDKVFLSYISKKYNLSKWEINCLVIDVKTKISQIQTNKDKIALKIISLEKDIKELKIKPISRKNKSKMFRLKKKLKYQNNLLSKDIVFGTKQLLRRISFLSNDKEKNRIEIKKLQKEFKEKRVQPLNYTGNKTDNNSNRYFDFDFKNQTIIYKPNAKTKIEIKYSTSKKYQNQLLQLEEIKNSNQQPITVRLSNKFIYICFDEEKLNGFDFNQKEYYKEIKEFDSSIKKQISQKYCIEQKDRRLKGKNKDRFCNMDFNPEFVGYSITEKTNKDEEFKILETGCFGLEQLSKKNRKSSNHKDSFYLTNKRKYELSLIYKSLFKKIKHYNCGTIVTENLEFKEKNLKEENKEFNRKCKNIWKLDFQMQLIQKHCNETGVIWEKVKPHYTSFIGNMKYSYFDPINASIEIGRRGMFKYNKGFKYLPELDSTLMDTMSTRFKSERDVLFEKGIDTTWQELFAKFKETKQIYRWSLTDCEDFKLFSKDHIKSKVNLYSF
jgi:IS605 OrfB family transposase